MSCGPDQAREQLELASAQRGESQRDRRILGIITGAGGADIGACMALTDAIPDRQGLAAFALAGFLVATWLLLGEWVGRARTVPRHAKTASLAGCLGTIAALAVVRLSPTDGLGQPWEGTATVVILALPMVVAGTWIALRRRARA